MFYCFHIIIARLETPCCWKRAPRRECQVERLRVASSVTMYVQMARNGREDVLIVLATFLLSEHAGFVPSQNRHGPRLAAFAVSDLHGGLSDVVGVGIAGDDVTHEEQAGLV